MTPAEYRTLRQACFLSIRDAALFHQVGERTINYWESGRNGIPSGAVAEIRHLNDRIEAGVRNRLTLIAELDQTTSDVDSFNLFTYRTEGGYAGSTAAAEGLPLPAHQAMIARTLLRLRELGVPVLVTYADPPA